MLELLTVTALLAILAALAVPSFGQLSGRLAMRAATQQLLAGLALARATALGTGQSVTVCPTTDGVRCRFEGDWWMIFANAPGGSDARLEPGESMLRRFTLPERVAVTGTRGYVTYLPEPRAATTATLELRHARLLATTRIIISQTGRPRVSRDRPST